MTINSGLGIAGVIFIIVGIIMLVIGVALLIANSSSNKSWWEWGLFIAGILLSLIGTVMLAIALMRTDEPDVQYIYI